MKNFQVLADTTGRNQGFPGISRSLFFQVFSGFQGPLDTLVIQWTHLGNPWQLNPHSSHSKHNHVGKAQDQFYNIKKI